MWRRRAVATKSLAVLVAVVGVVGACAPAVAGADTDPTTLSGQGGSFLQPVISKLLLDDSPNFSPILGAYTSTGIDSGIAAFVGSGPGQFSADYAVSERPLTATEATTAKANGRSFAYVPFASTPVAIATLVPSEAWANSAVPSITATDFCQHMQMSTTLLGEIFGVDTTSPLRNWGDPRVSCPPGSAGSADNLSISLWANLDPSMANYALMDLLDSTPASKSLFDAGLAGPGSLTTDDTPSENWPYAQDTIPGGDQPLIGKLLNINPQTNAPSTQAATWQLGATGPISSVWTGAPLGVPWNLSTAAVQNAQGSFVAPSTAAAQASAGDATLASTSDPTTDNLVTFPASSTDAAAYNNYLMVESYLIVPTSGLTSAKANALAQLIRFTVGAQGQKDIEQLGAAGATPAMTTADLQVAAQLNASAAVAAGEATTTTTTTPASTTTTTTSTTSPAAAAAAVSSTGGSSGGDASSGGSGGTSGGGLAFTGASGLGPLLVGGLTLMVVGTIARRKLKLVRKHS
jgi:ABC-type phosphate transport system substrate-binding protein